MPSPLRISQNVKREILLVTWVFHMRSLFRVCPLVLPNVQTADRKRLTIPVLRRQLPIGITIMVFHAECQLRQRGG